MAVHDLNDARRAKAPRHTNPLASMVSSEIARCNVHSATYREGWSCGYDIGRRDGLAIGRSAMWRGIAIVLLLEGVAAAVGAIAGTVMGLLQTQAW